MPDARTGRQYDALPAFARRQFILGACASAASLAFAATLGVSTQPAGAFGYAPPAGGGLDAFVALSRQLTGRKTLDATLARRIYDALVKADAAFEKNIADLNIWLKTHGGVPSDTVTAALAASDAPLAKTVGKIMRAWYLGLVGDMPTVQVLAYERALMFDPVSDVLTIPSYCRDVPFYWTHKPTDA
ncbi:sugar dehydrogenase complex small subunit [Trinickia fusca]|uniref:Sorbitol dehydrogenase n=1 Tax=Trinickia fusca TaxID=2419777 RepID=A0A494XH05_9BURK|nr:sugar dehydrogenase complex small subunit [Trinickia fusca]RKP47449.1 sorbitol dehydrogenase [Trinickia fusca]